MVYSEALRISKSVVEVIFSDAILIALRSRRIARQSVLVCANCIVVDVG
jgi:hypothetical protein